MRRQYAKGRKEEDNRNTVKVKLLEDTKKENIADRKAPQTKQQQNTLLPRTKLKSSNNSLVSSVGSRELLYTSNSSLQTLSDYNEQHEDSINVVVRVRPLNSKEIKAHDPNMISFPGKGQILLEGLNKISGSNGPKTKLFSFNVVFEPSANQDDVFNFSGIRKLVRMAVEGYNTTCFCYGQTGSGKTHTLTGPPKIFLKKRMNATTTNEHGLVFRSFTDLFESVKEKTDVHYVIKASFLEIYNEKVIDLLNPGGMRKSLSVRWSKKSRNFIVENLFTVDCQELQDLQNVLEEGMKNRSIGSHNMNKYSGRSHTILTVHINSEQQMADNKVFITKQGKINFVDLAGSETTKKTNSSGKTLEEANNINKSLMVLGYCISSLSDPKKRSGHIPYRDSKLTKLLADSLAGTGISLMIACVSPALSNVSETLSTLRYAARAKRIRTKPIVVMDPRETLIISLKREVEALQNENEHLRTALDLSRKYAADIEKLSGSRESLVKTPAHVDLEKISSMEGSELVDLIKHYATENEALRKENADLFNSRDMLTRDHEMVCRENERLLKKLENMNLDDDISFRKYSNDNERYSPETDNTTTTSSSHNTSAEYNNDRRSSGKIKKKTNNANDEALPDAIQREINRKGIGKVITNLVETLKRRSAGSTKTSGRESHRKSAKLHPHMGNHQNIKSDEQILLSPTSQNLLMVDRAFGSPLSSASGYATDDTEGTLFGSRFDNRIQDTGHNYNNNNNNILHNDIFPAFVKNTKEPSTEFPTIYRDMQPTKDNYKQLLETSVTSAVK